MLLRRLLTAIVPPRCYGCGSALAGGSRQICAECESRLSWLPSVRCVRCALPLPCHPCPAAHSTFARAVAAVQYRDRAREIVLALKRGGSVELASTMAIQLLPEVDRYVAAVDAVVPVPPHRDRYGRRGFDHADRLARALATALGLPLQRCLRQTKTSTRQVGLGRELRHGPTVELVDPAVPTTVFLVDDVYTTGATLDACARVLRGGGVRRVIAVAYARTLV